MSIAELEQKLAVAELSSDLKDGFAFCSKTEAEQCISELTSLRNSISEKLQELNQYIVVQREQLSRITELRQQIMVDGESYCSEQLPMSAVPQSAARHTPIQAYFSLDRYAVDSRLASLDECLHSMTPISSAMRPTKKERYIPTIGHLSDDEFLAIPSYLRGRLSCDAVNVAVDELNKVLQAKYTLLQAPRNKLSDRARQKINLYNEQDIPEVRGQYYFVDSDIKSECNLKLDPAGKNKLAILRHCGRLREIHEKNFVRYVVLGNS